MVDLEPYLGAMAHVMVLSADGRDFVHVHAVDSRSSASRMSAHAVFPRAGLYKLWAQLQRQGKVATIPFVVRLIDGRAGARPPSGSPPARDAQHQH